MKLGLTVTAAAVAVALSQVAYALEVQTNVSSQRIAVGEQLVVQLVVMSNTGGGLELRDLRLPLPPGMSAGSPSVSPQSQVSIINGQMSQRSGATVTWTVSTSKAGSFKVGPPSASAAGERAQGQLIPVEVVAGGAAGAAPPARRPFDPFNFMDPFGSGGLQLPPGFNMRSPFDDDNTQQQEEQPSYPDELRVDKAPDQVAFLRSTLTPEHVVVGEQVTLKTFAYGGHGQFSLANANDPSHADFLAFDTPQDQPKVYLVPIGGTRFIAAKLRDLPLFPLHAGKLRAGDMKADFTGRGYPAANANTGLSREGNWAEVIVSEPPLRGRPPGYKIGDVGDYKLTVAVEPRSIVAGEAISVIATLSGTGMVPFKIQTPEQRGVEWLEPALTEKLAAPGGVVAGSRTFSYVVKLNQPGGIDLGEVSLPYYNAKRREYQLAHAALGVIAVKPNPNAKAATVDPKPNDRLADVLHARGTLGPVTEAQSALSDRRGFWAFLWLAPFGVVLGGGALRLSTRVRQALSLRGTSLSAQLDEALRDARAQASKDPESAVSSVERAVFLAIELKLGLRARAVLKSELAGVLVQRGLSPERAQTTARILEDCDAFRFVGAQSGVEPLELARRAAENAQEMRGDKLTDKS